MNAKANQHQVKSNMYKRIQDKIRSTSRNKTTSRIKQRWGVIYFKTEYLHLYHQYLKFSKVYRYYSLENEIINRRNSSVIERRQFITNNSETVYKNTIGQNSKNWNENVMIESKKSK